MFTALQRCCEVVQVTRPWNFEPSKIVEYSRIVVGHLDGTEAIVAQYFYVCMLLDTYDAYF